MSFKFFKGFLIGFVFLNLTLLFNLGILKLFLSFEYQPGFILDNYSSNGLINLYIGLTTLLVFIYFYNSNDLPNLFFKFIPIPLFVLFFIWYCDILYIQIFNNLIDAFSNNENIIKLK